jgi:hypothetical protein
MDNSNQPKREPSRIIAILSLVVGIIGILLLFISVFLNVWEVFCFAPACSFLGLIFGVFVLLNSMRKNLSKAGVVLSLIGLFFSFIVWALSTIRTPW